MQQTTSAEDNFSCIFFLGALRVYILFLESDAPDGQVNSFNAGSYFMFLSPADFFETRLFHKQIIQEHYQCPTVWIQITTDILSALIWVQFVCKYYQQTTKAVVSRQRVEHFHSKSSFAKFLHTPQFATTL